MYLYYEVQNRFTWDSISYKGVHVVGLISIEWPEGSASFVNCRFLATLRRWGQRACTGTKALLYQGQGQIASPCYLLCSCHSALMRCETSMTLCMMWSACPGSRRAPNRCRNLSGCHLRTAVRNASLSADFLSAGFLPCGEPQQAMQDLEYCTSSPAQLLPFSYKEQTLRHINNNRGATTPRRTVQISSE